MSPRSRLGRIGAPVVLLAAIAGCGATADATPETTSSPVSTAPTTSAAQPSPQTTPAPATTPPATSATQPSPSTDSAPLPTRPARSAAPAAKAPHSRFTAIARHQYNLEIHGGAAFAALHKVGHDPTLLRLLRSGNTGTTRAYVRRQFSAAWYHLHVSRMRILRGTHVVIETGVPFAVAPVQMTLHSGGRPVGTLQVSIQDEIGFVRLLHRHHPMQVVVRGQRAGHIASSLPAAAVVKLPPAGTVSIAGQRYRVSSFREVAWDHEPVTVSVLQRG